MRKFLAILLSAVMVLSLAAVCVSAADATVINSAADFAGMQADGNYKLGADITISATYATAFTGTFDGNGKTVTTSVPLFEEFDGTAKNLTIKGAIDTSAAAGYTGAFAKTVNGNATFTNITNEASVKGYLTDVDTTFRAGAGGIVGTIFSGVVTFEKCENKAEIIGHAVGGIVGSYDDSTKAYDAEKFAITFTDCKNSGHITASQSTKTTSEGDAGGILGIGNKIGFVTFTNCTNTGKVEADNTCNGPAGGICAYIYTALTTDGTNYAKFTGCVNSGEVISAASQCGGIVGWSRLHSEFTDCVNSGYIHSGKNTDSAYKGYCAGIACRANADYSGTTSIFTNCLNSGNVESGRDQAGGILAYNNAGDLTFINCTNTGKIGYSATPSSKTVICAGIVANHGNNKSTEFTAVITCKNCVNKGDVYSYLTQAGAFVGYIYGTNTQYGVLENCVNYGTISGTFASQFIGYTNTLKTTIKDCIGAGKVATYEGATAYYPCIFGCSSAGVSDQTYAISCPVSGVMLVEGDGTEYYSYATAAANIGNCRYLDKDFVQDTTTNPSYNSTNAGAITRIKAADVETKVAALGEIGYKAASAPATGDNMVWVAVVALVSVLGMGISVKARKA